MSTSELKNELLNLISKINNKELLLQINDLLEEVMEQNVEKTDFWDELDAKEQKALDNAIDNSYDLKNQMVNEDVMAQYKKWLKKYFGQKRQMIN